MRIRTGYERVIPHLTSETFACVAERDGKVEKIDNDLKIIRIRYVAPEIKHEGLLSTWYTRNEVMTAFNAGNSIYLTVDVKDQKKYPLNKVLLLNNAGMFRVAEIMPYASINDVPGNQGLPASVRRPLMDAKGVLYIRMAPVKREDREDVDVFQFGDKYTSISGSHLRQTIVLNVKAGEFVKKGDVLAYNSGFFEPDPDTKQVTWKHGVVANVALLEKSETYEDSCEITAELGERLTMSPGHVRTITMTNNTALHTVVSEGDHVETTDYLCVMEDGDLDALGSIDDPDTLEVLADLNRKMPTAKFYGKVAEVNLYHACDYADLHPSLQKIARKIAQKRTSLFNAAEGSKKEEAYPLPQKVPVGTKFNGVDFSDDSVVALMITISEDLGCSPGDKLVVAAQAKTVIGQVMTHPTETEDGQEVSMHFSGAGFSNRILSSPIIMGLGNAELEKLEKDVIDIYFNS